MAYEKTEGDVTLNKNRKRQNAKDSEYVGNVFLKGEDRPLTLYAQDVKGQGPTHWGHVDVSGSKHKVSVWFNGEGLVLEKNRPNFSGYIDFEEGRRPFAAWQRKGDNPWWTGKVDFSEERLKPLYKADGDARKPMSSDGAVAQEDDDFDLDDIPF